MQWYYFIFYLFKKFVKLYDSRLRLTLEKEDGKKAVKRRDSKDQNDWDWARKWRWCLWPDVRDLSHMGMCAIIAAVQFASLYLTPMRIFRNLEGGALLSSPFDSASISTLCPSTTSLISSALQCRLHCPKMVSFAACNILFFFIRGRVNPRG